MKGIRRNRSRNDGMSLVEVLVVIVAIGVLGAVAVNFGSGHREGVAMHKLESDVRAINSAIQVFRINGGTLDGVAGPIEVLDRLKARADSVSAEQTAGFTGRKIDARLVARIQSSDEAVMPQARALWNAGKQAFEVAMSGPRGVKLFEMSEEAAASSNDVIAYEPTMKLATQDEWIWDYTDVASEPGISPTVMPTATGGGPATLPGPGPLPGGTPLPGPVGAPVELSSPIFSIPKGKYPISDFDLSLYLMNPNPPLSSRVLYKINGESWEIYAGDPITVAPASTVLAKVVTLSPDYSDSLTEKKTYKAQPDKLDPPIIIPESPRFDFGDNEIVMVQIDNPNNAGVSFIQYRVNNGDWATYTGPFAVDADTYPLGAKIRAKAAPTAEYYSKSKTVDELIGRPVPQFSGKTIGYFNNPVGGSGLVTNLGHGETDILFRWGEPYRSGDPPSWMRFDANRFDNVEPNVRFALAKLEYYNGTIMGGTGATTVRLNVELDFDAGQYYTFDYDLELINTPNSNVRPEEAADIVRLSTLASNSSTTIDGDEYYLVIEFGETSANGFSSVDQFHVLENASATGTLYATLILASDLDINDPLYFGDNADDEIGDDLDPVEETLAPLLLALDATTIDYDIPSIEEIATDHGVDAKWLISKDTNPGDPADGFNGHAGNPWLNWSEYHAGDEILLPGGTLSNHGWWTLGDKPDDWANDFAEGLIPEGRLRGVAGPDFMDGADLSMLYNRTVVAVVYDGGLVKKKRNGIWRTDLNGNRLGRLAFTVIGLEPSTAGDPEALWDLRVRIEPPILEPTVYDLDPWATPTRIPGTGAPDGGAIDAGMAMTVPL